MLGAGAHDPDAPVFEEDEAASGVRLLQELHEKFLPHPGLGCLDFMLAGCGELQCLVFFWQGTPQPIEPSAGQAVVAGSRESFMLGPSRGIAALLRYWEM